MIVGVAALPRALATACSQVDRLAVQLPRPVQPEFAGFVVPNSAVVSGAPQYSSECLKVTVRGGGAGFDSLSELKAGRADVAIAEGAYVAQQVNSGESLTVVAGYYMGGGVVYVGLQKYTELKDLAFKKVGVWCCGYDLPLRALIANLSVSVPVAYASQHMETMEQLKDNNLDVATAMAYGELARPLTWLDPSTNFLRQRSDLYVLDPDAEGITSMHNVLVVRTSQLASIRAKLVKFLRTVTKTWIFCRDNENTCAAAFSEHGVATPVSVWQMREVNRHVFPALKAHGLGVVSRQRWNKMNDYLIKMGAIQTAVPDTVIDNTAILDADALIDSSIWTPNEEGHLEFCAPYGTTDVHICQGDEHTLCPAGAMPTGPNDGDCTDCIPGRFAPLEARMNLCEICPSGKQSSTSGTVVCESCPTGRYWSVTDTSNASLPAICEHCPMGRFTFTLGTTECRQCPRGYAAGEKGQTQCKRCLHGSYASSVGSATCQQCLDHQTTVFNGAESVNECICGEGTYLKLDGTCARCPRTMFCAPNSKESILMSFASNLTVSSNLQYPRLLAGYWASVTDPFSVYLCWDENACPGGPPGTCGPQMEGVACGLCKEGYFRDGKKCAECTGADESPFNYPLIQVIFGPFVVFALYWLVRDSREDWKGWRNEFGTQCFLLLVSYQMVGLVVASTIDWPEEITSALWPWHYLVDVPDMLRLQCSEYRYFRNRLLVKTTAPLFLLGVFILTYIICFLIGLPCKRMRESRDQDRPRSGGSCLNLAPLDGNSLTGLFFGVLYTFYMCLCFVALQLFMCYEHPNGERSLRYGPEVSCESGNSSDWDGMLTEAILSIIFYIVLMIVGFGWIVGMAPRHFHEEKFRTRWNFLFRRFKPDCWWWSPLLMLRALLLCLTLALSQEGSRQVYWMFCVLLLYGAVLVIFFPWRHRTANLSDALSIGVVLFFCALGSTYGRRHDWLDESISRTAAAVTFSPLPVVVVLCCWVFWKALSPTSIKKRKAEVSKLANDARISFTKVVALEKPASQAFIQGLSEQDRDTLRNTCAIIVAELLGHQPGKVGLKWRLVHQDERGGASHWTPHNSAEKAPEPGEDPQEDPEDLANI